MKLLDEIHVRIEIDKDISPEGRRYLLKNTQEEIQELALATRFCLDTGLSKKDQQKYRITVTKL